MDYIPPRVKLSEDTFVFLDGKWVNETYIQSAFSSSPENLQKHTSKKICNDWTLWEENKALWEENKALRMENRALREENKALQCLRMENKGIQVIYDESLQQVLQQDKALEGLPNLGLPNSIENKALQVLREENKALQVFRENNVALKIFPDKVFPEKKSIPVPVLQKEKLTVQLLGKEDPAVPETSKVVTVQENSAKVTLPQAIKPVSEIPEDSRTLPVLERSKTPVSLLEENEAFLAVQKLNQIVLSLLRENQALLEEKRSFHTLQGGNKILWEENNKLKLQHSALKGAINKIVAQIDALQQELNTLVFLPEAETETKRVESC
ncbi:protein chibby homolog 2 [Heteronotia binoei]|uniref:protein chibby homolog 2 n=1 Tax=Heteronotia binoei TaxID=13085 RepID=UPI00292FB39B|nr:protein chibby homolog 2 [Heteronotia binoei]